MKRIVTMWVAAAVFLANAVCFVAIALADGSMRHWGTAALSVFLVVVGLWMAVGETRRRGGVR